MSVPMTMDEVARRACNTLGDYRARTALDLTNVESLRIVVTDEAYRDLLKEAIERRTLGRATVIAGVLRIHGIITIPDQELSEGEVRLRTELEA